MDQQLVNAIAQGVAQGIAANMGHKNYQYGLKAPATTPTTNMLHGPGGLFGICGGDGDVISARITPRGLASVISALPSQYTNPLFPYITGIEESGDDEPQTECATCPSGETESCYQTAQFGFICRESQTITPNRAIERLNRGETDLVLVNDILGGGDMNDLYRAIRAYDRNTIMQVATAWAMLEIGVLFQNALVPMTWQGNPANNVGTGYAEFPGLDQLISTGKVDALTNTACAALDSDVKDFNYQAISTVDANGNFAIVQQLEYLEAYLYHNADRMNLLPVDWVVCMRPECWYELTNIWPIAYMSTRNIVWPAGLANVAYNIDSARVRDMIDGMRGGMTIAINGRMHRVVLDDGIYEYNSTNDGNLQPGEFASNIYFVPVTYLGGRPGTFYQHKDYRAASAELRTANLTNEMWTDAGRFLWTYERIKWCYTLSGKVEPRIVLKTPQIAGRLNHVKYTPAQHFREPWQDSDYFYKGGVSERAAPSYYPRY